MTLIPDALQTWIDEPGRTLELLDNSIDRVNVTDRLTLAQVRLAKRFAKAFAESGNASALDLAVLIRQLIRSFNRRFWIPHNSWQAISQLDQRARLYQSDVDGHRIEVSAEPWKTDWLSGTEQIDYLETRRDYRSAIGSGSLFGAYGHETYQSEAQKAAVELCQFAPYGSTTLVTLPTGGGKSLCALLPAWIRTHGGNKQGSVTIVILPTVALALDQVASAQAYFRGAQGPERQPRCWTASSSDEEREEIKDALENGTMPLLFTSPESLMNTRLRRAAVNAAKRGNLDQIVIDEAHIVESWGAQFRTEFQLVGTFLQELAASSTDRLRVTLLSATVDQRSEELLQQLFGFGAFTILRANAVRPEPSWWFKWETSESERRRKVLEALLHLPRPAILYVTSPADADNWKEVLRAEGYRRVDAFTGSTSDAQKSSVLQRWRSDGIDLMVATSAFGLGVDKPDVRTVIHACLPETVDRFYQEVGRGGRDGNSCVSLICATERDLRVAFTLTSASIISTEKAVNRWLGMRLTAKSSDRSDLLAVNIDAPPIHNRNMESGPRNREWNMHTLLLLQRAGMLRITTSALPMTDDAGQSTSTDAWLAVLPIDLESLFGTDAQLAAIIHPVRTQERNRVKQSALDMKAFVVSNAGRPTDAMDCVGRLLGRMYPDCALACGGCPACRHACREPYADRLEFFIERDGTANALPAPRLEGVLAASIGRRARLTILKPDQASRLVELVAAIVAAGVEQVIVPEEWLDENDRQHQLIRALSVHPFTPHQIMPDRWLRTRQDVSLRNVPTAVIYHGFDATDNLHKRFTERWRRIPDTTPLISVIEEGTVLPSETGRFVDRIPGVVVSTDELLRQLQTPHEEWF